MSALHGYEIIALARDECIALAGFNRRALRHAELRVKLQRQRAKRIARSDGYAALGWFEPLTEDERAGAMRGEQ